MSKHLGLLIAGTGVFWLLTAVPARYYYGNTALTYSATAAGICLIPSTLTLLWSAWAWRQTAEQQLLMVLGGTGLRLFVALLGSWLLYEGIPHYKKEPGYWFWVLLFYLYTLVLDVIVMVVAVPATQGNAAAAFSTEKDQKSHGA